MILPIYFRSKKTFIIPVFRSDWFFYFLFLKIDNIKWSSQTTVEKCHVWWKNEIHLAIAIEIGRKMFSIKLGWNWISRIYYTLLWFSQCLTEYTETFSKYLFIDWKTYLKAFEMVYCSNCINKITQIKIPLDHFMKHERSVSLNKQLILRHIYWTHVEITIVFMIHKKK